MDRIYLGTVYLHNVDKEKMKSNKKMFMNEIVTVYIKGNVILEIYCLNNAP